MVHGAKKGQKQAQRPHIAKDDLVSVESFTGLYGLAEGEIEGLANGGKSIRLDGTPLINDNGTPNFSDVSWEFRTGTQDQSYIKGFASVESETRVGVELRHDRPFVRAIRNHELSAVSIRLNFNALREQKDNGDIVGYAINYAIDVQIDGGAFVEVLRDGVRGKASQGYKKSHRIDLPKLPASGKSWTIRVRRITPNRDSDLVADTMSVDAITEIIDAKLRYPNTALLALTYNAKTFSNVAKIAVRLKGKIIQVPSNYNPQTRTYTGLWDGTFKMAYSNNPAWVFYDLCTHKRYGLGERLAGMVDKWRLYQIGQYCDEPVSDGKGGTEPRFAINVYIQKADDAYRVLQNIASVFRGMSFWDGSQIVLDSDTPKDPVYTFSPANVVGGEFVYQGTRARDRHNFVRVAWDNPDNNFETEYEPVRDDEGMAREGIKQLDINAFGCTSKGQAQRAGQWALKAEQLETQTVSFKTGLMGFIPQVGQIINVADNVFAGRAVSGRIVSVSRKTITLDRTAGKVGDTLTVNTLGQIATATITAVRGKTITLDKAMGEVGDVWAIISDDLKLMQFRVLTITQNDDATFDITALQYDRQKYAVVDNGAIIKPQPYTVLKATPITAPNSVTLTANTRTVQGQAVTTLSINWEQVQGATAYIVEWRKDDGNWQTLPKVSGQSVDIDGVYGGAYIARVRAVDSFDNESLVTTSQLTNITGKAGKPPKLAKLTATGTLFGMKIDWSFNAKSEDTAYTEIQVSPNGRANIATLGQFAYPTDTHQIQGLQGNLTQFYRAKIVDKLGNESDWTDWVSGTTSANPQAVLDILEGQINETTLNSVLTGKINTAITTSVANTNAINKEIRDRATAIQAETTARTQAIQTETTARNNAIRAETIARTQAIQAESTARTTAINAKATEIRNALTTQITTLQNGLTQEIQNRKDADNSTVSALNAYKVSNDNAVATVLQKAETAISVNNAQTTQINALQSNLTTVQNGLATKLDSSAMSNYYTKAQADDKIQQVTTGKIEEFKVTLDNTSLLPDPNMTDVNSWRSHYGYNINQYLTSVTDGKMAPTIFRKDKSNPDACWNYSNTSVPNNRSYKISAWVRRASTSSGLMYLTYRFLTASQNINAYIPAQYGWIATPTVPADGNWHFITAIANLTNRMNISKIFFGFALGHNTSSDYWELQGFRCEPVLSSDDIDSTIATATALQQTNTNVSNLNNTLTSQSQQLTQLRNDLTLTNANVATKADTTALNTLDSRVTQTNDRITAESQKITALQNSLNTVNGTLNSKANSSALSNLNTTVQNINGVVTTQANKLTQLESGLNTVNQTLNNKVNASALSDYYTKAQADNVVSGKIDEFKTNLIIGGENILRGTAEMKLGSGVWDTATFRQSGGGRIETIQVSDSPIQHISKGLRMTPNSTAEFGLGFAQDRYKLDVGFYTYSFWINGVAGDRIKIQPFWANQNQNIPFKHITLKGGWEYFSFTGENRVGNIEQSIGYIYYISKTVGNSVTIVAPMLEKSTIASAWQPSQFDIDSVNNANAQAISTINSNVSNLNNTVTSQGQSITQLNNSLNATNTNVSKKADTTALTALDNKVNQQGNNITTHGSKITQLENSLNAVNQNINTKASSSALSTLDSKVTGIDGRLSTQASQITQLTNNLNTTNNQTLDALKLSAMITNGKLLYTDVNFKQGLNSVDVYNNSGNGSVLHERIAKRSNNPTSSTHELKITRKANMVSSPNLGGFYQNIQSAPNKTFIVKYLICLPVGYYLNVASNATGNNRIDKFIGSTVGTGKYETYLRYIQCGDTGSFSTSGHVHVAGTAPTAEDFVWYLAQIECYEVTDYQSVDNTVQQWINNATSSLTTLTNQQQSQSQQLTNLHNSLNSTNATVSTKADATALTALDNKVTQQGNNITTQGSKITQLENSLNTVNQNLNTKASSTALSTLDSKVTTLNNTVNSQGQAITQLNNSLNATNTNVSKKADATALTALDNKVTQQGNNITTQGSKITQLENSLNTVNQNLNTKASSTALSTLDSKVTTLNNTVNSQGQSITQLNNSLNATNTNISKKADTTALTALDNRVTQQGNNITSQANQITQLESTLNTVNQNLNTKANASALNNYYTKTEADNAMSGRVDTFRASLNTELAKLQKVLKVTELDLRHLDENIYYPIAFTGLHHVEPRLIRISRNLSQYPEKPTWARHSSGGFSLLCEWIVNGSGWGTIAVTRNITTFAFAWTADNQSPLININQMTNSSQEYCYLRGGARYKVETHDSIVATIRTTTHTVSGQSIAPMSYNATLIPKSDKQAVEAQITEERTARTNATTALTQQINTMNTTLNGQSTTISQQTQTINGISAVRAVTVDNNGVISGYGLMSELRNGRVTSQFGVNADTFYIGSPSNGQKPFIFNSSPRVIDGVSYPAGAWINSAFIANATIQMAHIQDSIQSDNFVQGRSGWRLYKNGELEINSSFGDGTRIQLNSRGLVGWYANGNKAFELGIFD